MMQKKSAPKIEAIKADKNTNIYQFECFWFNLHTSYDSVELDLSGLYIDHIPGYFFPLGQ